MKVRIALAAMAGCMALAACGGGNNEANTLNADDNLMTDMNAGMTDLNTTTDMNAMTDMNATTDMHATPDMNATDTNMDNTTNSY
jgi:hypothetical protein